MNLATKIIFTGNKKKYFTGQTLVIFEGSRDDRLDHTSEINEILGLDHDIVYLFWDFVYSFVQEFLTANA
jgi:hypothetical protein